MRPTRKPVVILDCPARMLAWKAGSSTHAWTTGFSSVPMPSIVMPNRFAGLEAEVVGRHDAGAGQQDDSRRKAVVPTEPVDQVLEAAGHPGDARLAVKDDCRPALDFHADADRLAGGHGRGQRDRRAQVRSRRRRPWPAADTADSRPRCRGRSRRCRS